MFINQFFYINIVKDDNMLRPGIDPGPLAWKASMQPLTLTEQVFLNWELFLRYIYTRCRVRTCADSRPVGLKSTALTTRPTWHIYIKCIYKYLWQYCQIPHTGVEPVLIV